MDLTNPTLTQPNPTRAQGDHEKAYFTRVGDEHDRHVVSTVWKAVDADGSGSLDHAEVAQVPCREPSGRLTPQRIKYIFCLG